MLYEGQCGRQRGSATKQAQSVFAYTDPVHLPARSTCWPSSPAWPQSTCTAPVHLHGPSPPTWPRSTCWLQLTCPWPTSMAGPACTALGPPAGSGLPVSGSPACLGPPARPWVHLLAPVHLSLVHLHGPVHLHGLGLSV